MDVQGHDGGASPAGLRKPRKSRGRGLRATTGCVICRKRHMKCNEIKPTCGPCAKGKRICVYRASATDGTGTSETPRNSPTLAHKHARHASLLSSPDRRSRWSRTPTVSGDDDQTNDNVLKTYRSEIAPFRWFGLLAGDSNDVSLDLPFLEVLGENALAQRYRVHGYGVKANELRSPSQTLSALSEGLASRSPSKLLQYSSSSSITIDHDTSDPNERRLWQSSARIQLNDHEHPLFQRFVNHVSLWIDQIDPLKHFSTYVPHLALYNEGLLKAILALGARHFLIKSSNNAEARSSKMAAVQYYHQAVQYLQFTMRYASYKNSEELLATLLLVSTYEMIGGDGEWWDKHLKGVFWILRRRDINGQSGGLEQATWWAWIRQDIWLAFRERRRCFTFFLPTKPYHAMDMWDMASRVVYLLAQAVNFSSDEEKKLGESDLSGRLLRAKTLLDMLEEWRNSISIHFRQLPCDGSSDQLFKPIWIHPPAFGASMQMFAMARIILSVHQPVAVGHLELLGRNKIIAESIDIIGGIALRVTDDASQLISTQCLFAAGLYCTEELKRNCIIEMIQDHSFHTGWPSNIDLAEELQAGQKQDGG